MSKRVLVVEDEPQVSAVLLRMLREGGYVAVAAPDGVAALQVMHAGELFDLLLVDQRMPGLDGRDLIRSVLVRLPDQAIVHLLGDLDDGRALPLESLCRTLDKPFTRQQLLDVVEACIGKP